MEGARPANADTGTVGADRRLDDAFGPPFHLGSRAPGEGQQQDPGGINAIDDEVGGAVRQRVGFSGAGSCDDEQWR